MREGATVPCSQDQVAMLARPRSWTFTGVAKGGVKMLVWVEKTEVFCYQYPPAPVGPGVRVSKYVYTLTFEVSALGYDCIPQHKCPGIPEASAELQ